MTTTTIKVSSKTNPKSAAGAIASQIREGSTRIESTVVGAGALNQLIKSVAIARGLVASKGIELSMVPSFAEVEIAGEERTALLIVIQVLN